MDVPAHAELSTDTSVRFGEALAILNAVTVLSILLMKSPLVSGALKPAILVTLHAEGGI
jgi:hypothetical protein